MKQKLELNWIGKNNPPNVEPRILIHKKNFDYGDSNSENILIHGDNLLALKSLEQNFAGRIKCVYIDPPYNTGAALEHYDDNLEHSIWLNLMAARLKILKNLLHDDGSIFIQIDDYEQAYLKVLCDEIFERPNFITSICVKMSHLSGVKMSHINRGLPKLKEFILVYCKNKENFFTNPIYEVAKWSDVFERYTSFVIKDESNPEDFTKWKVLPLRQVAIENNINVSDEKEYENFCIENANCIFRTARNNSAQFQDLPNDNNFREILTATGLKKLSYKCEEVLFCSEKMQLIDEKLSPVKPVGDIWTDIGINNLHNEGGVSFKNGKKPEKLLERILTLATNPGEIVLDSFLGSGTTAAVAHKMGRRWIGIELEKTCYTHCIPRLKKVIDGEQGGISKNVGWQGGGGFKFYELAPTLIVKDKFGMEIINPKYDAEMLAAAVAKHNGFIFAPDENIFWKQGKSQENSYIYTTTNYLTTKYLDEIAREMRDFENLLICAPAFDVGLNERYENISVKKIPQSLLKKCEYDVESYDLKIGGGNE